MLMKWATNLAEHLIFSFLVISQVNICTVLERSVNKVTATDQIRRVLDKNYFLSIHGVFM